MMNSNPMLPSGTITFLFTDIEGSTRLWEQHPRAMRLALARHDELLRGVIERHGGYIFKTVGDAFCATFAAPAEALAAALEVQHALLAEEWGETPIRVRMALHTGNAEERDGDYFGPAVNRVARLLSAGHGGQVLLSQLTEQLVRDNVPQTITFRSLGSHRLKDLGEAEHVFQVAEPGLVADFPALNTLSAQPNNLPAQTTSFIGRETHMMVVSEALAQPEVRLLTLTGLGGTGKTRLALQVAAENLTGYADGAFFVSLAPVSDPDFVVSSIIQTLGVRSSGRRPQIERLKEYLSERQMLLVLDNFEHVVEAAPIISELLAAAPRLTILATSRLPLQLYGERVYQVPPLDLPDGDSPVSLKQLAGYEAVQLFVDRAAAVRQDFVLTEENALAVTKICARLDGLPLAIELAAARMRLFPPALILERLENRMQFLGGVFTDLPERQRTLRATIEWSENLLSEVDQILFRRLAVFAGGGTFAAAEVVCRSGQGLDVLRGVENLLDHNLLRLSADEDEPRVFMLETIREYARERLEDSGEADLIRQRHADFFLALAETAEPEQRRAEQTTWLARLEREHDNFRSALSWLLEQDPDLGLQLSAALGHFWHVHGHYSESRAWLAKFMAAAADRKSTSYAKALNRAGMLAFYHGNYAEAFAILEQAVDLWRELGEEDGLAQAIQDYAMAFWGLDDLPKARATIAEGVALFRKVGNEPGLIDALFWQGFFMLASGDLDQAQSIAEEALALAHRIGDVTGVATSTSILGHVAYQQGDYTHAYPFYKNSLHYFRNVGDLYGMIVLLISLANVCYTNADYVQAQSFLLERLQITRTIGHRIYMIESLSYLGLVSSFLDQEAQARGYFMESLRACSELEEPKVQKQVTTECLVGLALMLLNEGKPEQAAQLIGAVEGLQGESPLGPTDQDYSTMALTKIQERLSEERFTPQRAAGRAMTVGQAISAALQIVTESA